MHRRRFVTALAAVAARAANLPRIRRIGTRKHTIAKRDYLFVEVETDGGITGLGEASLPYRVDIVEQAVLWLEPHLVNQPVSGIEDQWNRIFHDLSRWRDGSVLMTALASVDIALWDIEGKRLGEPLWRLLGASQNRPVPVYYSHWDHSLKGRTEAGWSELVERSRRNGWNAVKWVLPRAATEQERTRNTVRDIAAVRKAGGPDFRIALEMFETFSVRSAIEFAHAVAPYRPWFIEEPVERENPQMLGEVAARSPVPVAAGEGLLNRHEFRALLEAKGAGILQPDVIHCGGITEMRKISALVEMYGGEIAPHMWYGPIAHAASVAAMTPCRNLLAQEWDGGSEELFEEITKGTLPVQKDGAVRAPDRPGLGLEMDWGLLERRFPYAGRRQTPKSTAR
ncbi:MAG: mandelate racemase/muconate lactonizing enzyme family protein [Acidobacteria bacterium]|nr:mandelate racemase/muconate lactonizing enzyme family protein [Acidobacteriota bacterium]